MKIEDLKKKSKSELHKALKEVRFDLDKLRISVFEKKEKNVKKIGGLKKDIAKIMTFINMEEKDGKKN